MHTSLTKFCKVWGLAKTSVHNRCKELGIDTSNGLSADAVAQLVQEFDLKAMPQTAPEATTRAGAITVTVGNHQVICPAPSLEGEYSLESLRTQEVAIFDDPLAIAEAFVATAQSLTDEMRRDVRLREQQLRDTQTAKQKIEAQAQKFRLEARLYQERTELLAIAQNRETEALQEGIAHLKSLGKPSD